MKTLLMSVAVLLLTTAFVATAETTTTYDAMLRAVGPSAQADASQLQQIASEFVKAGLSQQDAIELVKQGIRGGLTGAGTRQMGIAAINIAAAWGGTPQSWTVYIIDITNGGYPAAMKLNNAIRFASVDQMNLLRELYSSSFIKGPEEVFRLIAAKYIYDH
jgi:hypothetical protein